LTAQDNRGLTGSSDSVAGCCGIGVVRNPAPDRGAETDEILKEYGFSDEEIENLKNNGITAIPNT
jgi:crotonobetainyl-CoA:carnitine CoA-transferase CaiB-like acyl-CoA transferase